VWSLAKVADISRSGDVPHPLLRHGKFLEPASLNGRFPELQRAVTSDG